jgi:flagellar basal body-associated protein FliL
MKPRRGLSEIIASLTVLIIVSVLGVMLYSISTGAMSEQQNNLLSKLSFEEEKARERFEIVGVEYTDDRSITLWVLNYSNDNTLKVTISSIYVNSQQASFEMTNRIIEKNIVSPVTVILPSEILLTKGHSYNILVVSERGVGNACTWIYS